MSVGELLWDVFGDTEFLGGAPLNFAANSQRLGNSVVLLTAVGDDPRGRLALEQMRDLGLDTEFVQIVTHRPTGTAVIATDSSGSASFVIGRPAAFDCVNAGDSVLARIEKLRPDWIYFGTLAQTDTRNEEALIQLVERSVSARRFYDINLRTGHWNLELVVRLSRLATVLKLNDAEAKLLYSLLFPDREFSLDEFCRHWSANCGVETICITLGAQGCAVFMNGAFSTFPGHSIHVVDTVGAGDAFAAAFLHGINSGWPVERTAGFANALGALVASRAGATPVWTLEQVGLTASSALSPIN